MKGRLLTKSNEDQSISKKNAVMARKALKAEIKINWPRVSAVISDKQYTCSIVEVFCFSSSETFSVGIAAALE